MILPRLIQPVCCTLAVFTTTVLFLVGAFCLNRCPDHSKISFARQHEHYNIMQNLKKHPLKLKCKITDSYIVATFKIFKLMNLISLQAITTCGHSNYYNAIQHCTSTGQPTCNCLYSIHVAMSPTNCVHHNESLYLSYSYTKFEKRADNPEFRVIYIPLASK